MYVTVVVDVVGMSNYSYTKTELMATQWQLFCKLHLTTFTAVTLTVLLSDKGHLFNPGHPPAGFLSMDMRPFGALDRVVWWDDRGAPRQPEKNHVIIITVTNQDIQIGITRHKRCSCIIL